MRFLFHANSPGTYKERASASFVSPLVDVVWLGSWTRSLLNSTPYTTLSSILDWMESFLDLT